MTFIGAKLWRWIVGGCAHLRGKSARPVCSAEVLEERRLLSVSPSASGGSLSGQATAAAAAYDLSSLGQADWAHWGRGGVYGKFDHDADGGSEISDISVVGNGAQTSGATDAALTFNWDNGSHDQTDSAENGYIRDSGAVGSGFSFTVPADTDPRSVTVFAGGDGARITLDAHLSDSSAADYTFTASSAGLFNEAITINFSAASADQVLTITLTKQGDVAGGGAGSVDLSAAALNLDSIKSLATFSNAPIAGPVMDDDGNFYATFADAKGYYSLYKIPAGGGTPIDVGTFPHWNLGSDLIADSAGDVFGSATCDYGYEDFLFEIPAATHKLETLTAFDGPDGGEPGNLMLDGAGDLFGITQVQGAEGNGTLFEVPRSTGKFETLAAISFSRDSDSGFEAVVGSAGDIYFTETNDYYDGNADTIFELPAGGDTVKTLYDFSKNNFHPYSLTVDRFGNLYCSADDSGEQAVFQFARGSRQPTRLYTFGAAVELASGVVADRDGNLYGSTVGYSGSQSIFEIYAKRRVFRTLASYGSAEDDFDIGNLILDGAGDLFGTAGNVVELPAGSRNIKTFGSLPDGGSTEAALLADGDGNLYGISAALNQDFEGDRTLFEVPHSGFVPVAAPATSAAVRSLSVDPVPGNASLSGQSSLPTSPIDLTSLGTGDWAHWGTGGLLNAFDDNANASNQISDIAILGSGAEATALQNSSRAVSWSNGTPQSAANDETGYLSVGGPTGTVVSFTVPADQNQRTLYIDAGGTNSLMALTAHLSDSSAADYVAAASGTGVYTNLYTLVYEAGSDNQTLTITLQKTGNIGGSDGSVDLVAAALRGPTLSRVGSFGSIYLGPGFATDPAGNVYVATSTADGQDFGLPTDGVVYKFSAGTYTQSTLATISGAPLGGSLVIDKFGNLYGLEEEVGDDLNLVVTGIFEIPAGTNALETIVPAAALADTGFNPSLTLDSRGNLFLDDGELLEVAAGTHTITVLSDTLPNVYTYGDVADTSGDLFGIASDYATMSSTVYEVPVGTSDLITVATLAGTEEADLVAGADGNIYGSSSSGGKFGDGAIFEITPADRHFRTLLNYRGAGGPPNLQVENDGEILGVSSDGTQIDEFFPTSAALVQLATLPPENGGGLIADSAGNLYGFGSAGSDPGTPLIFRVTATTGSVETVATFTSSLGYASGPDFVDSAGNFVGLYNGSGQNGLYELIDSGFDVSPSAPVINYQPTDETGVAGHSVSFNASVNSTPAPSVQWQMSADGGKTFTDIAGNPTASTESLVLDQLGAQQAGEQFRAVFSNSLGTAISNAATLSIVPPLKLVTAAHARAATVSGTTAELSAAGVDPSGKSKLTYTWSVLTAPTGAPSVKFSANGTAGAAHVRATFGEAGKYTFNCTISDGGLRTLDTQTSVTVVQTAGQVVISRPPFTLGTNDTAYIHAYVNDQFGNALRKQPAVRYAIVRGFGYINAETGAFTASRIAGIVEVRAASGSLADELDITVEN